MTRSTRDLPLTPAERDLRDALLVQCDAWLRRHARVLHAALDQARTEHAGDVEAPPPYLRITLRADLVRHEPTVTVTGQIEGPAEDLL